MDDKEIQELKTLRRIKLAIRLVYAFGCIKNT